MLGLLALAAVVLAWRRLAGALSTPLETHVLAGVAVFAGAAAVAVRKGMGPMSAAQDASAPERLHRRRWHVSPGSLAWTSDAALAVLGAALSLPGTSPAGLALLWAILAGGAVLGRWPAAGRGAAGRPAPAQPSRRLPEGVRYDPPQAPQPLAAVFPPAAVPPEDVVQQLTRGRAADGSEVLAGWLRVEMAAGQRTASLHVAFCPPFAQSPRLAVEQLGGPAARIKTMQLLPYGVRFDLKLDQPSPAPASVLLQFAARSRPGFETGETGGE